MHCKQNKWMHLLLLIIWKVFYATNPRLLMLKKTCKFPFYFIISMYFVGQIVSLTGSECISDHLSTTGFWHSSVTPWPPPPSCEPRNIFTGNPFFSHAWFYPLHRKLTYRYNFSHAYFKQWQLSTHHIHSPPSSEGTHGFCASK